MGKSNHLNCLVGPGKLGTQADKFFQWHTSKEIVVHIQIAYFVVIKVNFSRSTDVTGII